MSSTPGLDRLVGAERPDAQARGLGIVRDLLHRLHANNLAYCHWKSNEHVAAAVEGLTDLDMLVDRRRSAEMAKILADCGFRRFAATAFPGPPAVEDYLGFDGDTGRLVHLQVCYRLTLGQPHLKGYRLPWEDLVLASRRFDPECGIYVADPSFELLLLLLREALTRRRRTDIAALFRTSQPKDGDAARERAWLLARADRARTLELARELLDSAAEVPVRQLLGPSATEHDRRCLARITRRSLRRDRSHSPLLAELESKLREALWFAGGANRRTSRGTLALQRIDPRRGVAIALLGPDGAGKSSLCFDLQAWLGAKLDVVPIYFGSGDGPGSLLRLPLMLARRLMMRSAQKADPASSPLQTTEHKSQWGRLRAAALLPWALTLSHEKTGKLRRLVRARKRGLIVICDRYPQAQVSGFNDGPLLHHLLTSGWRVARALADWEQRPYVDASQTPPDLVIKLIPSPRVAFSRRPEMSLNEIERRIQAVRSLRFSHARVIEIDADLPFDIVSRTARKAIWDSL